MLMQKPNEPLVFPLQDYNSSMKEVSGWKQQTLTSVHVGICARRRAELHVTDNNMIQKQKLS